MTIEKKCLNRRKNIGRNFNMHFLIRKKIRRGLTSYLYPISLFSIMGDMEEGGVKKWVTSFIEGLAVKYTTKKNFSVIQS